MLDIVNNQHNSLLAEWVIITRTVLAFKYAANSITSARISSNFILNVLIITALTLDLLTKL
jgi:hypothetical protein